MMKFRLRIKGLTLVIATLVTTTTALAWDGPNSHTGRIATNTDIQSGFGFNLSFKGQSRLKANNGPRPVILRGVNFRFDSAELTPESKKNLDSVALTLGKQPDRPMVVGGHASAEGGVLYNLDLSTRRAKAVRNYLVKQGVKPENLSSAGFGEMHPVANNATEQGRSLNRRVELTPAPVALQGV